MKFIFDNPVFILMIIGYLISMFAKKKKEQPQHHKGSHRKFEQNPSREVQETFSQTETSTQNEEEKQYADHTKADHAKKLQVEALESQYEVEKRLHALKKQQQLAVKRAEQIKTIIEKPITEQISVPQKEKKPSLSPSKKQLVDGIVWAEIIGPPRALNPHRSLKNNK
ncbi:hypothetical protein F7731_03120 [Cytobacillus depressus]|uniref:Uncharacterized protein n=1 Tax=Cytobacillus depressus TaxID=1602942 RepID=A0A6L3VD23_9BACI|nr:hypothetical protein [Cytobacillus depressus]KAB2338563.1 hypothetical protein F7731_03120 [Cytobacillus depressus]